MIPILKQAREVGTSAGVLLPRSWLNKQVVVSIFQPSEKEIAKDVVEFLYEQKLNEEVKGIYLFGSYSRRDFDLDSDIDILIITDKINKIIKYQNYEIILVSEANFSKNISNNLNYSAFLREAKVIFNKGLLEKYNSKKNRLNIKNFLSEISRVLGINKESIKMCGENNLNVPDGIVYSIVLRLRELYLIKCLLSGKRYYKKDFMKFIDEKIYAAYLRIKRNERELNLISADDLMYTLDLSQKWLKELKD